MAQPLNDPESQIFKVLQRQNTELYNNVHTKLLEFYSGNFAFSAWVIEHYDRWLDHGLPKAILGTRTIGSSTVQFVSLIIEGPDLISNTNRPKSPKWCVQHQETYEIEVKCNIVLGVVGPLGPQGPTNGTGGKVLTNHVVSLFKVPLMVGSKRCTLSKLPGGRNDFPTLGMDPIDPLAYFVIKGTERLVLIHEKLRKGQCLFSPVAAKDKKSRKANVLNHDHTLTIEGRLTNDHPTGGKLFILEIVDGILKCHVSILGYNKETNKNKRMTLNSMIFFMYEVLTGEKEGWSYNTVINEIAKFSTLIGPGQIKTFLSKTYMNFFKSKITGELTADQLKELGFPQKTLNQIVNDLKGMNEFFPNCPRDKKIHTYCFYLARYIETSLGYRKPSDRDIWAVKQLATGTASIAQLVNTQFASSMNKLAGKTDLLKSLMDAKDEFNKIIGSSFAGPNWGNSKMLTNNGMTESLDRKSITNVYSQLTKINVKVDPQTKNPSIRAVQGDQYRFICPVETPEGEMCGLNKHLAITCQVSMERDLQEILRTIKSQIKDQPGPTQDGLGPFFINGDFYGWCDRRSLRDRLISIRRSQYEYRDISVFLENMDPVTQAALEGGYGPLWLYTDSGRPIAPLLIVKDEKPLILMPDPNGPKDPLDFTQHGFIHAVKTGKIEFVDVLESHQIFVSESLHVFDRKKREVILLLDKLESLRNTSKDADMSAMSAMWDELRGLEISFAQAKRRLRVTHMELDPVSQYGFAASLVPLGNHIHGPRIAFQAGMNKQALTMNSLTSAYNFDSYKMLVSARRPIFETDMSKILGLKDRGGGVTLLLAIMPLGGYNQEDAIVVNERTNNLGYFAYIKYVTKEDIVRKNTFITVVGTVKDQYRYRHLSATGYVKVGSKIEPKDVLIHKIKTVNGTQTETSVVASIDDTGVVERVESFLQNGDQIIRIKIRQYHYGVNVGDKLAIRYSQKGVVGLITSKFPTIMSGPYKGCQPDVLINPHAMPSRMTVSLLIEMLTGKVMAMTGERFNATTFKKFDIDDFMAALKSYGMDQFGEEIMRGPDGPVGPDGDPDGPGVKGKIYDHKIMCGPIYYISLPHFVKSKIQARSVGNYETESKQPNAGRGIGGGLRLGEMEVWAIVSHGALEVVKDRLINAADPYDLVMCQKCNRVASFDLGRGKYICSNDQCSGDKADLGKLKVPYSLIRFLDILKVGGVKAELKVGPLEAKGVDKVMGGTIIEDDAEDEVVDEDVDEEAEDLDTI